MLREMPKESNAWQRTERLDRRSATVTSIDVLRVALEAQYRRRHPDIWERLRKKIKSMVASSKPEA